MKVITSGQPKKGLHLAGKHYVMNRLDYKVGQQANVNVPDATEHDTLTAAKKAAKSGKAIVRAADSKVISVR